MALGAAAYQDFSILVFIGQQGVAAIYGPECERVSTGCTAPLHHRTASPTHRPSKLSHRRGHKIHRIISAAGCDLALDLAWPHRGCSNFSRLFFLFLLFLFFFLLGGKGSYRMYAVACVCSACGACGFRHALEINFARHPNDLICGCCHRRRTLDFPLKIDKTYLRTGCQFKKLGRQQTND